MLALRLLAVVLGIGLWIAGVISFAGGGHVLGGASILAGALAGVAALMSRTHRAAAIVDTVMGFFLNLP
jgi:hypothetical protein